MDAPPAITDDRALLAQHVALSVRTVADQQQIIVGLQALVDTLKARVQQLEASHQDDSVAVPPLQSRRDTSTMPAHMSSSLKEELDRLRGQNGRLMQAVAALQCQRDALTSSQQDTAHRLSALEAAVSGQHAELDSYARQAEQWERDRAHWQLLATQHQNTEAEVAVLRDDAIFEKQSKAKWRALASTLAERVDRSLQTQIQPRFFTLCEEERRFYQRRDDRLRQLAVPPRFSLHASLPTGRRSAPCTTKPPHVPSPTALPMWSRSATCTNNAAPGDQHVASAPTFDATSSTVQSM